MNAIVERFHNNPLFGEVPVTLFLLSLGFGISAAKAEILPFIERDPALSQPLRGSTIPTPILIVYGTIIPLVLIVILTFLKGHLMKIHWKQSAVTAAYFILAFGQSMGIALSVTNVLKNTSARQRPSFFYITNYAGYRDAVESGNYTAYYAATTAGAIGDLSKCLDLEDLDDSQKSFPSGHASIAFAGLAFLCLYLRWWFRIPARSWFSMQACLASAPLVFAAWIALTRVRDRKHFQDDIAIGSILGLIAACLAWMNFEQYRQTRDKLRVEQDNSLADEKSPIILNVMS